MSPREEETYDHAYNDGNNRIADHLTIGMNSGRRFWCPIGSFNSVQDSLYTGRDAGRDITGAKFGSDFIADDLRRSRIRQDSFQPVSDFQTNFTFFDRNEEQNAIVGAFGA